jgi:selenide,water dikinase
VLFAADMRAEARGTWIEAALASMQISLRPCVEIMRDHGVSAGTDVTGFGLAGHLLEMLEASDAAAILDLDAIPVLAGAAELSQRGIESTLRPGNEASAGQGLAAGNHPTRPLLFDPQTTGGLLFGVPADQAEKCVTALHATGSADAAIIGTVQTADAAKPAIGFRA